MIDRHLHPEEWGLLPVLFRIGGLEISSYPVFVTLGLLAGLTCYFIIARRMNMQGEKTLYIALAGIVGGVLGAKLPYWIINFRMILDQLPDIRPFLEGRTITGGLIGGTLGVIYIKWRLGITDKRGNLFAPAIAVGVAIGRIGCLFRGCCYGTPTDIFLGMDFGDRVPRHPTQLYEIAFFLLYFIYALSRLKVAPPGQLFNQLINSYFIFRFFEEFIRYNERLYLGLSFFQYISLLAILFINAKVYYEKRNKNGRLLQNQTAEAK
jgi:phosphatidylglycerol:prolipoprotein diacylglycerol transferase